MTRTGTGKGRGLSLLQTMPWPFSGSFSRLLRRSSLKWALADRRAARSRPERRWKINQLSPWLRISSEMLPGLC
jgi:hypothetical protein